MHLLVSCHLDSISSSPKFFQNMSHLSFQLVIVQCTRIQLKMNKTLRTSCQCTVMQCSFLSFLRMISGQLTLNLLHLLNSGFDNTLSLALYRQEGWRLEHENIHDKSSPVVFKGVVFNEMKGYFVCSYIRKYSEFRDLINITSLVMLLLLQGQ